MGVGKNRVSVPVIRTLESPDTGHYAPDPHEA
jgi:hypothetical protein